MLDPALKHATTELRTLLERFANGKSMDIVVDAGHALIDDAQRDPELRDWFKKVNAYIHKVRSRHTSFRIYVLIDIHGRSSWMRDTSSSRNATTKGTGCERAAARSTTTSTRAISTVCLRVLGSGSRLWGRTR